MKIYNQDKTQLIENPDLNLGYLKQETVKTTIPAVEAVAPVINGYKVIKEYPNGGKDIEEIIEKEGIPYQAAQEIKEEINIYIRYTQKELNEMEINSLKDKLAATDYKALKYAEGLISENEYAPIKQERQNLRQQINQLENELNNF